MSDTNVSTSGVTKLAAFAERKRLNINFKDWINLWRLKNEVVPNKATDTDTGYIALKDGKQAKKKNNKKTSDKTLQRTCLK